MIAQGIAVAAASETRSGSTFGKSPVLACEDAPTTVLDCLLHLELSHQSLTDLLRDTTASELQDRWSANKAVRDARMEEA